MKYTKEQKMKEVIKIIIILFALMLFVNLLSAMTVTINIPEKYSEVQAGEKVYFETEVKWPENDIRKDLRIEYSIKDKKGQEIAYLKVLKAIETQASFMDSISVPESTKEGVYKIYLNMTDYNELNQEVAASFKIVSKGNLFNTYLIIILSLVGLIAIVVLIGLFILIRKKR